MEPVPAPQIKQLLILHFALFAGQFLFLLIAVFLVYSGSFPAVLKEYAGEAILLAALLEILAWFLSGFLYKRKLKKIQNLPLSLVDKLPAFRGANIIRWAILEAAVLLSIILFLLTNQFLIVFIILALFFIYFTTRPTAANIASDLQVSEQEVINLPAE